ncbi:MAG: hypothetical protein DRJ49_04145 [Thermoprotei archaeon]|nr:MAG: hypothetical protein DRJ49_04145 [Thermoprotei archaeon]
MKFTVLVDTLVSSAYKRDRVVPAHGLSILVEHSSGMKIMFSTGPAFSILVNNSTELGLVLEGVDVLFIPIWRRPLAGCYEDVITKLKPKLVCTPPRGLSRGFEHIVKSSSPLKIERYVYSTGIISYGPYVEHAMILTEHNRAFLFIGCAAYGFSELVQRTKNFPPLRAIIGGFHLSTLDIERFGMLRHLYNSLKVDIVPLFCTSKEARQKIINMLNKSYDPGVGFVYRYP